MGKLLVEEKAIVVPGDFLAEGMDYLPAGGAFRENDKVISSQVGVVEINGRLVKVIPLAGAYVPNRDDIVIGRVTDVSYSNWFVDIGYALDAVMSLKDGTTEFIERGAELSEYYGIGDFVVARVANVTKSKMIDISMKSTRLEKAYRRKDNTDLRRESAKSNRKAGQHGWHDKGCNRMPDYSRAERKNMGIRKEPRGRTACNKSNCAD